MDGPKLAGRIVYESKDTVGWQKAFIAKARQYKTQYGTQYVMIVTRAFPRKGRGKGLWVEKDVPIVEPRMAIALARIIREGVIEIGKLQISGTGRERKEQRLLAYILSDEFNTWFRRVADAVEELRDQQEKERDWHEKGWRKESDYHDQITEGHRKIRAQLKAITEAESATPRTLRAIA
jgi:hypothetical protein